MASGDQSADEDDRARAEANAMRLPIDATKPGAVSLLMAERLIRREIGQMAAGSNRERLEHVAQWLAVQARGPAAGEILSR